MAVSYMTRGLKWAQGREKRASETWRSNCEGMASWHKEQIQGQHAEKFGEDRGQEQRERKVLRKTAGVAGVTAVTVPGWREGRRLGLGVTRMCWGGLNLWDREGLGAVRERKEEGKRRWGWVLSRSGVGMDCLFSHCAGFRFSGVRCWRQGTTFYI